MAVNSEYREVDDNYSGKPKTALYFNTMGVYGNGTDLARISRMSTCASQQTLPDHHAQA